MLFFAQAVCSVFLLSQLILSVTAEECSSAPTGVYASNWGDASSNGFITLTCLTVKNDRAFDRSEVAYSGIPIDQSLDIRDVDLDRLVVVGANSKRIPAQFEVLSRWGGAVLQTSQPVRWLQVAIATSIIASGSATFDLRLYNFSQSRSTDLSQDVIVSSTGGNLHIVSTGDAQFTLDASKPVLLSGIQIGSFTILNDSVNAGPSIVYIPQQQQYGTTPRSLDASDAKVTYFEITESGPVKATALIEGEFSDPSGASLCDTMDSYYVQPYESFTYSLALTFSHGRSDIKVAFHVRNQCSNGDGTSWTDQSFLINKASYSLDFSSGIQENVFSSHYHGAFSGSSISSSQSSSSSITTIVEQRKGSGSPWRRRARVRSGSSISNDIHVNAPIVSVSDGSYAAGVTMSHMQYREPQALRIDGSVISIDVIGEQQRVGEGKGIWNHAIFFVRSVDGASVPSLLQNLRWPLLLEIGM